MIVLVSQHPRRTSVFFVAVVSCLSATSPVLARGLPVLRHRLWPESQSGAVNVVVKREKIDAAAGRTSPGFERKGLVVVIFDPAVPLRRSVER